MFVTLHRDFRHVPNKSVPFVNICSTPQGGVTLCRYLKMLLFVHVKVDGGEALTPRVGLQQD